MDNRYRAFLELNTSEQIRYLKEGDFNQLVDDERIEFLKTILKPDLSSKTTACALKLLRELNYDDRYFYKKFIYHVDSSVSNAAKKAMQEQVEKKGKRKPKLVKLLEKEKSENRVALVHSLFNERKKISESVLVSLLNVDEFRVREAVIKEAVQYKLNESKLIEAIKTSVWYVRAALVEILGNRQSRELLQMVDYLIQDKNTDVKLKLIEALRSYDRNEVREHLKTLSQDSNIFVKKEAEKVLATI